MWAAPAADKADKEELLRQADQYVMDGKVNLARATYERAIQAGADLQSDYTRARSLGLCYMNGTPRDYAKAARWLEAAYRLRPSAEDNLLSLAQALAWGGKHDAAIGYYRKLVKANPEIAEYVTGLANTLYWSGNTAAAVAEYDRYLERRPSDTVLRLEYARLLSYMRKLPEANNQYQAVLQADPHNVAAMVGMAKVSSWQDDFKGALEQYNLILKRYPRLYDAQVGKAFTLYWSGRGAEARTLFQAALKRNPKDKEVIAALKQLGPGPAKLAAKPAEPRTEVAAAPAAPPPPAAPVATDLQPETFETFQRPAARNAITVMMEQAAAAADRSNYVEAVHLYHQVLQKEPHNQAAMLQIARVLSWSKNYEESAKQYDALLQMEPNNAQARLERARVLSWGQNYEASVEEYTKVLEQAQAPPAKAAPTPAPQVSAVTTVTPQATAAAPADKPAEALAPAPVVEPEIPAVSVAATRLEMARVLAWSKRYDESLRQFNLILPPERTPEVKDKPVLIEKARVLSYSRNYAEAVKTYDGALALDPADIEARLGKGQTLYWWGRLDQAAQVLRPLMEVQTLSPESKTTTTFTLASVERGRGRNKVALHLLDTSAGNQEAKELRRNILQEMRPVLRFRFGWEDSEEVAALTIPPGTDSVTRALRYTSALEFNLTPDVRMAVSNTVTDGDTSNPLLAQYGNSSLAVQTMARVDFRLTPWLRMVVGAGEGSVGAGLRCAIPPACALGSAPRTHHFLYDVHPIVTRGGLRLEMMATRRLADYTPLSIHNNVTQRRVAFSGAYNYRERVRVGAEFWTANYSLLSPDLAEPIRSFETAAKGGAVFVSPTLYRNERVRVEAGMRFERFSFDDGAEQIGLAIGSGGFFTPRDYQRVAATGSFVWDPSRKVHLDFHGTFGPQKVTGFDLLGAPPPAWGTTGSVGAEIGFHFGRFRPYVAYDWFSTATAAFAGQTNGSYKSHSLVFGFAYRF